MWHKLMHKIGWFYGYCDAFYKGKTMYMSFVCFQCGLRTGIHPIDKIVDRELKKKKCKRCLGVGNYATDWTSFKKCFDCDGTGRIIV